MENTKDISPKTVAEKELIADTKKDLAFQKDPIETPAEENAKERGFKEGLSNNSDTEKK